jgi:hypothetical protein
VAEKLKAVAKVAPPMGCLPFGSDIMKESKTVSKEDWEKHRESESWRSYVENNHPEWL